jgi:hypothetical protein
MRSISHLPIVTGHFPGVNRLSLFFSSLRQMGNISLKNGANRTTSNRCEKNRGERIMVNEKVVKNGYVDFLQMMKEFAASLAQSDLERADILSASPKSVTVQNGEVQDGDLTVDPTYVITIEYEDREKAEFEVTVFDLDDYFATYYTPEIDPEQIPEKYKARIALAKLAFSTNPDTEISLLPVILQDYLEQEGFVYAGRLTWKGRKEAFMDLDYFVSAQ